MSDDDKNSSPEKANKNPSEKSSSEKNAKSSSEKSGSDKKAESPSEKSGSEKNDESKSEKSGSGRTSRTSNKTAPKPGDFKAIEGDNQGSAQTGKDGSPARSSQTQGLLLAGTRESSHEFRRSASARRKSPKHASLTPPQEFFRSGEIPPHSAAASAPGSAPASAPASAPGSASASPPEPKKTSRGLFYIKTGLIIGMSICLAVLLLLTLARIKKRQMASLEEQERQRWFGWFRGGSTVSVDAGGSDHGWLGKLSVPVAIGIVIAGSTLFYMYEQEVLSRQRQRQALWNWMKVGTILTIIGLGMGYKRVFAKDEQEPFHISWRLFVYCFLGVVAMSLAKLTFVVTNVKKKKYSARK